VCFRFNKLTDRFFKNTPWPEAEAVAKVVHKGEVFDIHINNGSSRILVINIGGIIVLGVCLIVLVNQC